MIPQRPNEVGGSRTGKKKAERTVAKKKKNKDRIVKTGGKKAGDESGKEPGKGG